MDSMGDIALVRACTVQTRTRFPTCDKRPVGLAFAMRAAAVGLIGRLSVLLRNAPMER